MSMLSCVSTVILSLVASGINNFLNLNVWITVKMHLGQNSESFILIHLGSLKTYSLSKYKLKYTCMNCTKSCISKMAFSSHLFCHFNSLFLIIQLLWSILYLNYHMTIKIKIWCYFEQNWKHYKIIQVIGTEHLNNAQQ